MRDGLTQQEVMVFTSWKEIASYLGKGIRTLQRWEAQFGLPVQRPHVRRKGIVRATREELDQWIATRWSSNGKARNPEIPTANFSKADLIARQELRRKNRALVEELRQTIEQIEHSCQDLAARLSVSREFKSSNGPEKSHVEKVERRSGSPLANGAEQISGIPSVRVERWTMRE